jgi:hypothetical protein
VQPLVKPENRWKVYMIVRIFHDVPVGKACTTRGIASQPPDLVLDKIVVKRYISDAEICSGFSSLPSDEPLLNHKRSCTYAPKELLALSGYFPAVDLRLGEGERLNLFLSYTVMHFFLKLFKSGTPKELEFLTDDLRIRV